MDPDSTTPPLEDEPPPEVDLPGFSPPTRPTLDPLDPEATKVILNPDGFHWSGEDPPDLDFDELAERREQISPKPEPPSSRSSFDPDVASAAAGLFQLGAVLTGAVLNGTIGKGSGAYLMHPNEADAISQPLGRYAARRMPVTGANAKDLSDGIEAGVATAAYVARATTEHFAPRNSEDVQQ